MIYFNLFKGKKIGILGLGKTGIASYIGLSKSGSKIIVYDDSTERRSNFLDKYPTTAIVNLQSKEWSKLDFIICSPGISLYYPVEHVIKKISTKFNIPILSDIDLLAMEIPNSNYIGITGTKGKSTTCYGLFNIYQSLGIECQLGGNIGTTCVELSRSNNYIIELSSFHLEYTKKIKLSTAIITNIFPDHLDRYKNIEDYISAKFNIINLLDKNGTLIINIDLLATRYNIPTTNQRIITISNKHNNADIFINNCKLYDNYFTNSIYNLKLTRSMNNHNNLLNIAAIYAASPIKGERGVSIIQNLVPLPHRLQYIGKYRNIEYYNDSKATIPEASLCAISSLQNLFWISGGILKVEIPENIKFYLKNIKKAYFYGRDSCILYEYFKNLLECKQYENLDSAFLEATKDAIELGKENNNILLSPMCSSLDQFSNAEERGIKFIKLFNNLTT